MAKVPIANTTEPSVFDLTLDHEVRKCRLSSIRGHSHGHYIYAIEFPASRSGWRGTIRVPEDKLASPTRRAWDEHYHSHPVGPGPDGMAIERSDLSQGSAKFLDLQSEEPTRDGTGMYLRKMEVTFQGLKFDGVAHLLKTDPIVVKSIQDARERLGAVESIEKDDDADDEWKWRAMHTVEFMNGAPKKGRKSDVEVWQMDGERVQYRGKASIRKLDEDQEGTRQIVIEVRMEGQKCVLKAEMRERMLHGRFMVIDQSEV